MAGFDILTNDKSINVTCNPEDFFDENPYHGKEHLRHADIQTTTQHYTSEKKPAGLINSLNKTTKKRHSVSS